MCFFTIYGGRGRDHRVTCRCFQGSMGPLLWETWPPSSAPTTRRRATRPTRCRLTFTTSVGGSGRMTS